MFVKVLLDTLLGEKLSNFLSPRISYFSFREPRQTSTWREIVGMAEGGRCEAPENSKLFSERKVFFLLLYSATVVIINKEQKKLSST